MSQPFWSSSAPTAPAPRGTAQAEAPVMFSHQTYWLISLGISVAFALLYLPAGILSHQPVTAHESLLLFLNPALFFQVLFGLNYLLRYHPNPVQRWLGQQELWTNRLLRLILASVVSSAYGMGRFYLDAYFGLRTDNNPLVVTLALAQVVTAVGFSFQLAIELVESSRHLTLENEALKLEQLHARYESLKKQLSPHFLFNSLATLGDLIYDEPTAAALFVEEMAQVYRYLLRHGEQTAVPLRDELGFLRSYVYLLHMRFGDGIQLRVNLPDAVQGRLLPPLALQLLVENAVKHNTVSRRRPLLITVELHGPATLLVRNTRATRLTPPARSHGVGLSNLTNRIRLLNQQKLLVAHTPEEFRVYVPLPAQFPLS